ncbi:SAM-dependent methyltransferase [Bdellovibrio sp. HCB337]|uniref:SAM-dependent methyltransferase n=1 Tax=Bdellovibrio sp. HCB337 TaxID=3394358 RepID=UPI0039A4DD24
MKINRPLAELAIQALEEIFFQDKFADKVIEKCMKSQRQWGNPQRKFFAETIYETVRWYRLLDFMANSDDLWRVLGCCWLRQGFDLPNWEEFEGLTHDYVKRKGKQAAENFLVIQSLPDWLDKYGREQLGADWEPIIKALNKPSEAFLRVNALKATPEEVLLALKPNEIEAEKVSPELPHALRLKERKNVFVTEAFRKGLFEMQDAGSQMIVPLLGIEPGHRVVDACAGSGGKTLHMSSLMKNKGRIIAMDIHEWKLHELKLRARRNGVDIIETRLIDSNKVVKRMAEQADRLLLDVPCSGSGVLRRNPDTKWKLTIDEIERLRALQYEILSTYSQMTKKGGQMVYATCSVFPSENEQQVERFLKEQGDKWTLVKEIHVRPDKEGYDGFYAALLKRK